MFYYREYMERERKWRIEGHSEEFNSLMEMKDALWLHQKDTVFDYARRNNLKIYCNEDDKGYVIAYHAKTSFGV